MLIIGSPSLTELFIIFLFSILVIYLISRYVKGVKSRHDEIKNELKEIKDKHSQSTINK